MDRSLGDLPCEHIAWIVNTEEDCDVEDSDGEEMTTQRMVMITDAHGVILAIDYKSPVLDCVEHIKRVLRDAMQQPIAGKPRRPAHVIFKSGPSLCESTLQDLGIKAISNQAACGCTSANSLTNLRACSKCRRRGDSHLFTPCPNCGCVVYCSKDCQDKDLHHPLDMHGHQNWCTKMLTYAKLGEQLADFPFSYASETTSETFGHHQYSKFLQQKGVYGQGLWQRELPHNCPKHMPHIGELETDRVQYVLGEETRILSSQPSVDLVKSLTCWREYYGWRGLSLDSPIAILLSLPLTLYHITNMLPEHYPGRSMSGLSCFRVHVIGVEKEVDMLPVFEELNLLLPKVEIDLLLVGPEISCKASGRTLHMGNVKITIEKGLYHQTKAARPDIVVGFNAGLGAYSTWGETLTKLKDQNAPAFFTDYCNYSCECAKTSIEGLDVGTISQVSINPFRSPIRRYCEDHTMPWYSNGFIYSLKYKE